jgi:hypothetical protein
MVIPVMEATLEVVSTAGKATLEAVSTAGKATLEAVSTAGKATLEAVSTAALVLLVRENTAEQENPDSLLLASTADTAKQAKLAWVTPQAGR